MNWQLWFEGLAIAAVTGATNGAVQALQNGGKLTGATGVSAGIGALLGVLAYLKTPATGK